jgi:hypothetical protein
VALGPAGINKKAKTPTTKVRRPYQQVSLAFAIISNPRDGQVYAYLNQKQPSPSGVSLNTSHVQQSIRENGRENVGSAHGRPEEAESEGQFMVLVKV